jgi:putative membrane protein
MNVRWKKDNWRGGPAHRNHPKERGSGLRKKSNPAGAHGCNSISLKEKGESRMMSSWSSRDTFLIAAVLVAGAIAVAQQPGGAGTNPSSPSTQQPTAPGQTMPGAQSGMPDNSAQSYGDQAFLRKTLEDNVAQEQMGQMASQKSQSDDVKQFGQKMAQIHEQLTNQLMPVAKKLGVDEPKNPSKKDRQEIEKMQALSGPDFDTAFIRAMLHDQQEDLKGFKNAENGAQDPNVQVLAKMDEPVLSQHLQVLEQLAQTHNVSTESQK